MQIEGKLFGWFETGLEGLVWALEQEGIAGYDGLFIIEEGDHLVISSPSGQVLFDDYIVTDTELGKEQRPSAKLFSRKLKDYGFIGPKKAFYLTSGRNYL